MKPRLALRPISVPDFGIPLERPRIPAATYAARCEAAQAQAGTEWLAVYGDREHQANIAFLTGFEPRFEEALLLLGPGGRRIIVTGNENQGYAPISPLLGLEILLAQSLSLMAQDRSLRPQLTEVLRDAGIRAGSTIGLVGWKYLEPEEWDGERATFFAPSMVVDSLAAAAGDREALHEATPVLMHPAEGLRALSDVDQIAEAEWGAARASAAVWRIVQGVRPGDTELAAAARMGYAGEPMTCHPMLSSAGPGELVIGLSSPSARVLRRGDGITTAVGYWGGLTARAGLLTDGDDAFLEASKLYFAGLLAWYETADIGVAGGDVHAAVVARLAEGGLRSALNPGHLTGHDEWVHSPIRPGSGERLASGMAFQVDIIPVPMPNGWALNCEDPVTFADAGLRARLRERHPAVWQRCEARRSFVRDQLGIELCETLLPLSAIPLCLPPFWLGANMLLVRE